MGICTLCGDNAGWFKSEHKECRAANTARAADLRALAARGNSPSVDLLTLAGKAQELAKAGHLTDEQVRNEVQAGYAAAVADALADSMLTEDEENRLDAFQKALAVPFDFETQMRIVKAGTIRDLTEGKVPERLKVSNPEELGRFNIKNDEQFVWIFPGATLLQERRHRTYEGVSSGMSVRVARGVYYRVGAFKGQPIDTTSIEETDSGGLVVTSERLIFAGHTRSVVLPLKKIATFQPFDDGIGVAKEGINSKLVFFRTGDGWFTYNLMKNLADIAELAPAKRSAGGAS
jgi:hypothetical protein